MNSPAWLDNAVFYEIYPQSFQDSNGDGIGDIPGIISRLDYIKSLGVNAIWLNPCFESPFQDAGYDISDFRKVAPRYGTNADLEELFKRAHAMGIKVILDLVAGHTSTQHPWFKASACPEPNRYSNYYIWTDSWISGDEQYRFINGYSDRDANFMINFFYCQPALNYGFRDPDPAKPWQLPMNHPTPLAVREELRDIMKFWLDLGADGFRVDMASSLVRGPRRMEGIRELWQDYRSWLNKNYPEAILVSEWSNPAEAVNVGFHIDFLVHFGLPGYTSLFRGEKYRVPNAPFPETPSFFDGEGLGDPKIFTDELISQLKATAGKGYVSIPSGNHDIGRVRQGRSDAELKVIHACIFTLPGVPFLYYGDEIGMDYLCGLTSKEGGYNRTGSRTPMQWDDSQNAGFSAAAPEKLYLPVDCSPQRPEVKAQDKDSDSLLNLVRQLIKLRRDNPALASDGEFVPLFAESKRYPWIYERSLDGARFIIALNPSGKSVKADFTCRNADKATALLNHGCQMSSSPGCATMEMRAFAFAIYRV